MCILTCSNPEETKYRQIPQEKLAELRAAFSEDENNAREDAIRSMVDQIYSSPDAYYPHPFQILSWDLSQNQDPLLQFASMAFDPYRKNYAIDDSGVPNTPGGILDVIRENDELKVLIKGEEANVLENLDVFGKQLESMLQSYVGIFERVTMPMMTGDGIPLGTMWLLKAELNTENCFIEKFAEDMMERLPSMVFSEEELHALPPEKFNEMSALFLEGFRDLCEKARNPLSELMQNS